MLVNRLQTPMKRRFINDEQLPFPEGQACGVVLDTLYHGDGQAGMRQARALVTAGLAAGAIEAIMSIKAVQTGILPPTINYRTPDPECDLDYVPHTAREMKIEAIANNSFGFGGHNATVIAKRFVG